VELPEVFINAVWYYYSLVNKLLRCILKYCDFKLLKVIQVRLRLRLKTRRNINMKMLFCIWMLILSGKLCR